MPLNKSNGKYGNECKFFSSKLYTDAGGSSVHEHKCSVSLGGQADKWMEE